MIDHDTFTELLPLLALDALEAPDAHQVLWHARSCDECGLELARYQWVTAALAPDGPPPRHLWHGIVAEIEGRPTGSLASVPEN